MVFAHSWFKYQSIRRKPEYGENNFGSTYTGRTGAVSVFRNFCSSRILQFASTTSERYGHTHCFNRIYSRIHFFIQQYLIKRDKILQKRKKHFETIKSVFEEWAKTRAEFTKYEDGFDARLLVYT
jgi:hypothetical protein